MTGVRHIAAAVAVAVAGSVAVAHAATPSSGKVSNAEPTTQWSGTLAEGAVMYNGFNNNPDAPCAPPACDTYALTVADAGTLTLTSELDAEGSSGAASAGFRITAPDGSTTFSGGPSSPGKPYKLTLKNLKAGDYTVDTTNSFVGSPGDYVDVATLGTPAPAATPTPGSTPAPTPAPSGGGGDTAGTTMKVATRKASARKLKRARKLVVRLSSSAPVDGVVVTLSKGKRKLASGKRASIASKGKVTLKLKGRARKLRKGSYRLIVTATDKQGRPVSAGATLKVRK